MGFKILNSLAVMLGRWGKTGSKTEWVKNIQFQDNVFRHQEELFSETEIEARAKEILAVSCVRSDLIVIQLGTQINLFLSADLFAKRFIAFQNAKMFSEGAELPKIKDFERKH